MLSLFTVLFAFYAILHDADSARVLGLFPYTGKSHQMVFDPLLRKLAERGHHVTVVTFFPVKNPPANYTEISLEGLAKPGLEVIDLDHFDHPNKLLSMLGVEKMVRQAMDYHPLAEMAVDMCSKLVNFKPFLDILKDEYDVIIMENFNSDCVLGLAHVYGVKAPVVSLLSSCLMPWSSQRIGVGYNPSFVPVESVDFTSKMTFMDRVENTLMSEYFKLWYRYNVQVKEKEIIEKHFGRKIPDLQDLAKNTSLMLVNVFHTLNGVRPLLPGVVEVGGMHLDHTQKAIPAYMEKFLNESEHGVVLFSFGSLIKTASIAKYKEEIIVKALSKLKQRVIWKYEDCGEEGTLQGNILKVRWIPQFQLLQHKKVVAFIGHGGVLGMTEAISAGKPMLVVPFFGDQPLNGAHATEVGFGRTVSYADITEKSFYEALQGVLSAEMRLSARTISQIWHDRQNSPLDTAVYWTERVIRWGHKDPLMSEGRHLPFYQYALLDVAAAVLASLITIIALTKIIIGFLFSLVSGGSKKEKVH